MARLTPADIRKLVRAQLCYWIQHDIDNGEYLMKEVWEVIDDDDQVEIVREELRAIMDRVNDAPLVGRGFVPPAPPPAYDEVFAAGVSALDDD